ncbi:taste receptor type 2 member 20-like [Ochotona curzoniae]|uniref:taste receptor type 2 member 20-like n=1 Tax=Ochotona curzoniae TaxID=130825 RepID=UPI001B3516E1|nr:taste receptor type 2 member 20-like [Ochotona curzoniae]
MFTTLSGVLFILLMVEFILGNFANAFIALVNCIGWMKREKLSSVDRIFIALAISRIALLWVILRSSFSPIDNPAVFTLTEKFIHNTWTVANHFSMWSDTLLSIFYLLRIANFSSLLFLHVKKRVESIMVEVILGSCVFLVCNLVMVNITQHVQAKLYDTNETWEILIVSNSIVRTLSSCIPFAMSLLCFLLLTYSLCKHLRKMKLNARHFQDSSTRVHIRAIQNVVSFLFLFALYFLCVVLSFWSYQMMSKSVILFCRAIAIIYPSTHSFVLIWGNKKLKRTFLLVLWQVTCWRKRTKMSKSLGFSQERP